MLQRLDPNKIIYKILVSDDGHSADGLVEAVNNVVDWVVMIAVGNWLFRVQTSPMRHRYQKACAMAPLFFIFTIIS
jgi:hypothetical protein